MTITYRTTGAWGAGKGSNLTPAEADNNFYDLVQQIAAAAGEAGASVSNVTVSGSQMTVFLDDGTEFGPFTLPRAILRWRGEFVGATAYAELDLFTVAGDGVYIVLQDHTAAATFDADDGNTAGDFYQLVFGVSLSVGTVATSTYTPVAADAGKFISVTAACVITLPGDADVGFAVGTEIHFRQAEAGALVFETDTDVTLSGVSGFDNATGRQGAVVTAKKIASDSWVIFGLLAETSA